MAAVLLVFAPAVRADSEENTQDTLFLIIANSGAFGTFSPDEDEECEDDSCGEECEDECGECDEGCDGDNGQTYTIINLTQFLPGQVFGGALAAVSALISAGALSAATGGMFEDFSDLEGFEFFLVGSYVASDHLLYGSDSLDGPLVPEGTQMAMIPGLMDMGALDPALTGLGGIATVSDVAFWTQMGLTPEQVNELLAAGVLASASAAGAGENVFGFTDPIFIGIGGFSVGPDGGLVGVWAPIPEPATCLLLAAGIAGITWRRRRARRAA